MTEALVQFCQSNPTDRRVIRLVKLLDEPMSINGNLGKLIGELSREVEG
jgi:hypothetical protein